MLFKSISSKKTKRKKNNIEEVKDEVKSKKEISNSMDRFTLDGQ